MSEQIMFDFVANVQQLKPAAEALRVLNQITEEQYKAFQKIAAASDQYNKSLGSSKQATDQAKTSAVQLGEALKNVAPAAVFGAAKVEAEKFNNTLKWIVNNSISLRERLSAVKQEISALGSINKKNAEEYIRLKTSADALQDALKKNGELMKNQGNATEVVIEKSKSLKSQLRALKEELAGMETAGKENTKEFERLQIKAGRLNDQLGDTANRIKVLADDSRYIKVFSEAISGVAAGYSVAQGAAGLFGEKNEEVEKALLKVNSAMAIANGLAQINTILQKQSYTAILSQIGAQKAYTIVVGESVGAMKAFRLALAATGVGLAIVGLMVLIENWDKIKGAINSATGELDGYIEKNELLAKQQDEKNEALSLEDSYLRSIGVSKDAILKKNQMEYDLAVKKLNLEIESQEIFLKRASAEAVKAKFNAAMSGTPGLLVNAIFGTSEADLKALGESLDNVKKKRDDYLHKSYDITTELNAINEDAAKSRLTKQEEGSKETVKVVQKENVDLLALEKQRIIDAAAEDINYLKTKLATFKEGSAEYIQAQHDMIDAEANQQKVAAYTTITNAELRNSALLLADAEAKKKHLDLTADYAKQEQGVIDKANATTLQQAKAWNDAYLAMYLAMAKQKQSQDAQALKDKQQHEQDIRDAAGIGLQLANDVVNSEFALKKAKRDAELNDVLSGFDKKRDAELKNKNLTEAQKDAINEKYARKEAEAKRKAYEDDKKAKIAQAVMNAALAVTNILATTPDPTGIATIARIAATAVVTAEQIRVINQTPIPKFAKGTKNAPAGFKLVGEEGPELIYDKGGYPIIPHRESMQIMSKWGIGQQSMTNDLLQGKANTFNSTSLTIDYNKLGDVITEKLANNPKVMVTVDKHGIRTMLQNGSDERQYLNDRFSTTI